MKKDKNDQKKKKVKKLTVEEAIQLSLRLYAKDIEYLKDK